MLGKIDNKNAAPERRFERIPGKRAECLDCFVMAYAARQGLALNLDAREASLKLAPQSSTAKGHEKPMARPRLFRRVDDTGHPQKGIEAET